MNLRLASSCNVRCRGFKLQSWIPLQTFKLQTRAAFKLETLKLSNFKLFILQTFQTFKLSNLVQHVIRSNSQKFEFEKPHS